MNTGSQESKTEAKHDNLNGIVRALRCLLCRLYADEQTAAQLRKLEFFRLELLLRVLRHAPFNAKMNALNELNRILTSISLYPPSMSGVASMGSSRIFRNSGPPSLDSYTFL